jgi:hypothetical protein
VRRSRRGRPPPRGALLLFGLLLLAGAAPASAGAPPTLPAQDGRGFLPALSIDPAAPGTSVPLQYTVANPLPYAVSNVTLTFELYAFNALPGTGRTALPVPAPTLAGPAGGALALTIDLGGLAASSSRGRASVSIDVPAGAPEGTYAIRDAMSFELNSSRYDLASIGEFAPSVWHNATVLPNGTPTLNLTRLGVSGILPETALLVRSSQLLSAALYALLGAAGALVVAGAYVAGRRRGPGSRSGERSAPPESHAPSAFGNSRSSSGD